MTRSMSILTHKSLVLRTLLAVMVILGLALSAIVRPASAACGTTNVALNKIATASTTQSGLSAAAAVDGNTTVTRWGSEWSDPQWLQVDLGSTQTVCRVVLRWEAAYGKAYQIQTSANGT